MSNLRILHVVHQFLPHHRHGAEISTWELASAQREAGHEPLILAGERGQPHGGELELREDLYYGLRVIRVRFQPNSSRGFLEHEGFASRIRDLLAELRPDLVHVQHMSRLSLSLLDAVHEAGLPLVVTLRDHSLLCDNVVVTPDEQGRPRCYQPPAPRSGELAASLVEALAHNFPRARSWRLATGSLLAAMRHAGRREAPQDAAERRERVVQALGLADRLLALSGDHALRLRQMLPGCTLEIEGLLQAIDERRMLTVSERQVKPGDPLRFTTLGKVTPYRGIEQAIEAMRTLAPGSAQLAIHGAPSWTNLAEISYLRRLRKLATGLPIHFQGAAGPDQVAGILARTDALVMPGRLFEPFGRVVAEALAAGVPVIAPDAGGPAEQLRDGVNGLTYRHGDSADLRRVLASLVDDPARLGQLRARAKPLKSFATYTGEIEALYRATIASSAGR